MDEGIILRSFHKSLLGFGQTPQPNATPQPVCDSVYSTYITECEKSSMRISEIIEWGEENREGREEDDPKFECVSKFLSMEDFAGTDGAESDSDEKNDGLDIFERALFDFDNYTGEEDITGDDEKLLSQDSLEQASVAGNSNGRKKRGRQSEEENTECICTIALEMPPSPPPPRLFSFALAWYKHGICGGSLPG